MAVRSEQLVNGERVRPAAPLGRTAIVSAAALARYQPHTRRVLAAILYGMSLAGTLLCFGGHRGGAAAVVAIIWQLLCSLVQWIFSRNWRDPLYLLALAASVVPGFLGYWPFVLPDLVPVAGDWQALAAAPTEELLQVAVLSGLMLIILAGVDIIPEKTLVGE